jgi:N-acetyltransferase
MTDTAARFVALSDTRPDDPPWPTMSWPPPADAELAGEVVLLSPCVPERDAADLFHALNHDAVWEHLAGRPRDEASLVERLQKRMADGHFVWVVRLRAPSAGVPSGIVGTSSYLEISAADARLEIGATAYAPAVWATKVNPECKLLLLAYAFDTLRAGRVQLKTDVRNRRSQEAIARLGARYEGTLRRYQRREDRSVRDTVLFSIVAEDWPAVRNGLVARLAAR